MFYNLLRKARGRILSIKSSIYYRSKSTARSRMRDSIGFVYICTGRLYTQEALCSIRSLMSHHALPVTLMTDQALVSPFDQLSVISIRSTYKRPKVDYLRLSPYEKTIYLDTDTIIAKPIDDLFGLFQRCDVFGTHDTARKRDFAGKSFPEYDAIPYAFPEINGGFLGLDLTSANVCSALSSWKRLYYQYSHITDGWDQPSLRVSLWQNDCRVLFLPPEYNVRSKSHQAKTNATKESSPDYLSPYIYHAHFSSRVNTDQLDEFPPYDVVRDTVIKNSSQILH